MRTEAFYVTGGTIPPDSPSYVERAADKELLAALGRGELCYVLNARQMGKSSLSVRTRQALEAVGTRTAFLDLQKFGSSASAEQWYRALLERIGSDLKLRAPFLTYWKETAELPPLSRLFGALRDVALEQIPGNIVVFLDEIDVVRDLSFKTDEFFGAIRESHNARADDPALRRLTFCIIGTVAPTDLIRDIRLSPFNIGTRVRLADLKPKEAAPLAGPLPGGAKTLDRVLWWTSGHPYLTQRLCAELANSGRTEVDDMVARLFFAKSDADVDENIKNVRNGLLRMGGEGTGFDRTDLLTRYGAIVAGKRVADDDTDGVCTALRLSGLVTAAEGTLRVRNRVYRKLFDPAWVRANLPDAEVRRQRAAVARARWQTASVAAAILLVMSGLVWRTTQADARSRKEAAHAREAEGVAKDEKGSALAAKAIADAARNAAIAASQRSEAALRGEKAARVAATLSGVRAQAASLKAAAQASRADAAAADARLQTAEAKHVAYISSINAAQQNIESGHTQIARQFLDEAARSPKYERGLEWDYLHERLHPELVQMIGHSDTVVGVAYSPDGKRVASASVDRTARIWDADSGRLLRTLRGHTDELTSVAFSADGKEVVTASQDRTARVWDTATGRQLALFRCSTIGLKAARFSRDEKLIIGEDEGGYGHVWDANSRTELMAIAFRPEAIADITLGKNRANGREFLTLTSRTNGIRPVVYACDTKQIASGDLSELAYHPRSALEIAPTGRGRRYDILVSEISPDGQREVYDSYDGPAIASVKNDQPEIPLRGHDDALNDAHFSPKGGRVVTASSDGTVKIWDAASGHELLTLSGHMGAVTSVAFSPDGLRVVTGSSDKTVRIWDAGDPRRSLVVRDENWYAGLIAESPDRARFVTSDTGSSADIYDSASNRKVRTLSWPRSCFEWLNWTSDGNRIISCQKDHTILLWDARSGTHLLTLHGSDQGSESGSLSPDHRRILICGMDKRARIWDTQTGQLVSTLIVTTQPDASVRAAMSSDGARVITTFGYDPVRTIFSKYGFNAPAKVWESRTGRLLFVEPGSSNNCQMASLSPDKRHIVTADFNSNVEIWDIEGKEAPILCKGHTNRVGSVVFSADGKRILSASDDRTVRLWDSTTGKQLLSLRRPDAGPVTDASFASDNVHIIATDYQKTVIWKKPSTQELHAAANTVANVNRIMNSVQDAAVAVRTLSQKPLSEIEESASELLARHPDLGPRISDALFTCAWNSVDVAKRTPSPEVARKALRVVNLAAQIGGQPTANGLNTIAAARFDCGDLTGGLQAERQAGLLANAEPGSADSKADLARAALILNSAAWNIVDPAKPPPTGAVASKALAVAILAAELSQHKDGAILDTLAAAQFACGDLQKALETERIAVRISSPDKALATAMAADLKHFEALVAAQHGAQK